jgi:hypothetical protein
MTDGAAGATRGRLTGWLTFVGALAALNYASRFADTGATASRDGSPSWAPSPP